MVPDAVLQVQPPLAFHEPSIVPLILLELSIVVSLIVTLFGELSEFVVATSPFQLLSGKSPVRLM